MLNFLCFPNFDEVSYSHNLFQIVDLDIKLQHTFVTFFLPNFTTSKSCGVNHINLIVWIGSRSKAIYYKSL